jgi:hypothetical protein
MAETIRGKCGSPGLPPKSDASAELTVPKPALEARKAPGRRTVRESDRGTLPFTVFQAGEKRRCVSSNAGELFVCGRHTALVVDRPPTLERGDIAEKVFWTRTHELHAYAPNENSTNVRI